MGRMDSRQQGKICPVLTIKDAAASYPHLRPVVCGDVDCAWYFEPEYEENRGCCSFAQLARSAWFLLGLRLDAQD